MKNTTKRNHATIDTATLFKQYTDTQARYQKLLRDSKTAKTDSARKQAYKRVCAIEKRLDALENAIIDAGIITAENAVIMGERIAIKAVKTCYQKGGQPFIYSLYTGLCADVHNRQAGILSVFSDGYDIAQTASAFLCGYIGKSLHDTTTDGQTDKDGNPATILRACFRAVNRYIMGERQHDFKRVYVDDIGADGATLYYEIPQEWDIPTATDYKHITAVIDGLNLTARQAQILRYRLRGLSIHQIADKMSIHRKTLQEHIKAIQRKYTEYTQAHPANA